MKMSANLLKDARTNLRNAKDYVEKIGKPDHIKGEVGKLASITVQTQIYHQYSHGANNYHNDKGFDAVLADVIKENFSFLMRETMERIEGRVDELMLAREKELSDELAEIQAIKQKRQEVLPA